MAPNDVPYNSPSPFFCRHYIHTHAHSSGVTPPPPPYFGDSWSRRNFRRAGQKPFFLSTYTEHSRLVVQLSLELPSFLALLSRVQCKERRGRAPQKASSRNYGWGFYLLYYLDSHRQHILFSTAFYSALAILFDVGQPWCRVHKARTGPSSMLQFGFDIYARSANSIFILTVTAGSGPVREMCTYV